MSPRRLLFLTPPSPAEADKGTAEFTAYWENNAALAGSKLVYNTGRSLGSFLSLLKDKAHCIAVPDVVITAVGTKIWLLDGNGRTGARARHQHPLLRATCYLLPSRIAENATAA